MEDPFRDSKYSIDHAERRIVELEREVNAFHRANPCERVIERDLHTMEDVHKIKLVKPMPVALSGIAFDAVNSLRAALDQAGYATAIAGGRTKGRDAHFPFGLTLTEVQSRAQGKGRSRDVPKEIFDVMVSHKPYRGGNDLLWALNQLCNTNKHEFIIPVAMGSSNHSVVLMSGNGPFRLPFPQWNRTKNELEFARVSAGSQFHGDFQFSVFVAFGNFDVVAGQSATLVLNIMLRTVKRILTDIEAESSRIRLFG